MTIRKGVDWGAPTSAVDKVVDSDAELRHVVERCLRNDQPVPPVGLSGGDLWRTVGGQKTAQELRSGGGTALPIDVLRLTVDRTPYWACAHVVVRRSVWRQGLIIANAQWRGTWNIVPKGHPNDGRLDVLEWKLGLGDLRKVHARLATGSFLPHPGITATRRTSFEIEFTRPTWIHVDGVRLTRARVLRVEVLPDAGTIVV